MPCSAPWLHTVVQHHTVGWNCFSWWESRWAAWEAAVMNGETENWEGMTWEEVAAADDAAAIATTAHKR